MLTNVEEKMTQETSEATRRDVPPYTLARNTCAELLKHADDWKLPVRVDETAAAHFRKSLNQTTVQAFGTSLAQDPNFTCLRCDFPSVDCEAAWIVLTHSVDFGSGWRRELHRHHKKGAWLTIKAGVESLFRMAQASDVTNLPAVWLSSLTQDQVARCFALQDNPELELLCEYLRMVLEELGHGCKTAGSLQEWVSKTLHRRPKSTNNTPAGDFVWALVDAFPKTFDDVHTLQINDEAQQLIVCFYKKAQLVTGELYHRFRTEDVRFQFQDGDDLTAYIDNVICAALRYKLVIVPNQSLTDKIETNVELPSSSIEEVCLRAAAMCGVESVVTGTKLSSSQLGNYLWAGVGKEPNVRQFARHATKTVFY